MSQTINCSSFSCLVSAFSATHSSEVRQVLLLKEAFRETQALIATFSTDIDPLSVMDGTGIFSWTSISHSQIPYFSQFSTR